MELFSIRIQRTFQLVSTHYGHYHFLEHFIIYIHHGMYLLYFLKVTTEIPPVRTVRVYTILL